VAAGVCDEVLVQVAYAIGVAQPVGLYVNTYGTAKVAMTDGQIAEKVKKIFDMTPYAIVERFGLKNPIYFETAKYGHFGRDPFRREVTLYCKGKEQKKEVDFFAWEKLDYVEKIQKTFKLS
jgi:S-adenosylmethionine synthetase